MKYTNDDTKFLPVEIDLILDEFRDIFERSQDYISTGEVLSGYRCSSNYLEVIFRLKKHPIHGFTGLRVSEKYDDDGFVKKYEYRWMIITPKMGVQLHHITSWGNDAHSAECTPAKFRVNSEPHHHHHDPTDRRNRKDSWDVRTVRDALLFIKPYIDSGEEYTI